MNCSGLLPWRLGGFKRVAFETVIMGIQREHYVFCIIVFTLNCPPRLARGSVFWNGHCISL